MSAPELEWLDAQLAAGGVRRTGATERVRARPWATVYATPTTAGTVWLKAAGAATAFEAGLYDILGGAAPRHVLRPLALDVERGWMALPDGGPLLADRLETEGLADSLAAILGVWARLQRAVAPEVDALLGAGVSDMRPEVLPARFEEALEAAGRYAERHGSAADQKTLAALAGLRDTVAGWCERLTGMPGGASLDHNDLHPHNIFVAGDDLAASARFYDWGDSVVAHPFASMLVPLGIVQRGEGDAAVARVRDAYLEPFGDLAAHAELVEALELACRVGKIARALTWDRALRSLPEGQSGEHAGAAFSELASLLDESYLGVA